MEVVWEYQLTAKKWVRYEPSISEKLTDEVKNGSSSLDMEIESCEVSFDFENLKQKTVETKFMKPIRCAICNDDKEYAIWEYLSGRRRWVSFLPETALQLEQLHKQVDITDVTFKHGKATISFEKEKMLYGDDGEHETKIRRTLSAAEPHFAGQPVLSPDDTTVTRSKKRKEEPENVKPMDEEVVSKKSKLDEVFKTAKKSKDLFAEVDEYCPEREKKQVYVEKKDVYNVMLNQTNIAQNNNKYFLIQLLQSTTSQHFYVFLRWGRVGFKGQNNLIDCHDDLEKAKQVFCNKFFDKTSNEFKSRAKFIKVKGKYDLIEMDYSKPEDAPSPIDTSDVAVESKIDVKIQNFLKLICDLNKMEEAAKGLSYDVQRAPLGKLTKAQIKAGYEALKKIEDCIVIDKFNKDFKDAVDEYYTRIPHYFGMRPPSAITTLDEIKQELELLEVLTEIEAAVSSINEHLETTEQLHPIDKTYAKLKCNIEPLEKEHERYKLIETYLMKTHAPAHDSYTMLLKNVYEVKKHGEDTKFKNDVGNKRLLWHGSRLTNWHGILSRGLRIAPKEAPVTGYMFGKGVYFADASSKSANYCYPKHGDTGVLTLAEVALGEINPKFKADNYAHKLPAGKSSVKGIGDFGPNPEEFVTIDDGVVVPCGEMMEQPETKDMQYNDLLFNEYIVYNTDQIKLRYLVEVEFHSKV